MAEKETLQIGKGKPGPGRPKGVPNKNTTVLKDAILRAAEAANTPGGKKGMVEYLAWLAVEHPPAFAGLLGKVLPLQVTGEGDGPLKVVIQRFSGESE